MDGQSRNLSKHHGEFEDSALLKVFGQPGEGIFPIPTAIENRIKKQFGVHLMGQLPEIPDKFHAMSAEKRVQHEATQLIVIKLGIAV